MASILFGSDTPVFTDGDPDIPDTEVRDACRHLLDDPEMIEPLGGEGRNVWRIYLSDGQSRILLFRNDRRRVVLETNVLLHLGKAKATVPRIYVAAGHWLMTEDLGNTRLSLIAHQQTDHATVAVETALEELLRLQRIGHRIGLSHKVAPIGKSPEWVFNLCDAPLRIANWVEEASPAIDRNAIASLLNRCERRFIKWDARPGNAMMHGSGKVIWFDFEHCGARDPLDDLAWFFGDESLDNSFATDDFAFGELLTAFAGDRPEEESKRYLRIMGCLHMCIRLSNILGRKNNGLWWDEEVCMKNDKVMVTAKHFAALSARAADWAQRDRLIAPLAPWLASLPDKVSSEKAASIGPVKIRFN